MKSFLDNFSKDSLTPEELQKLKSKIRTKKVAKGEILLRKGEKSGSSYFVRSGLLRSYTIDEKGKEHIFMFAPEGWVIGDIGLQVNTKTSDLFVDAIESSEIEVIDLDVFLRTDLPSEVSITKRDRRIYVLQKRIIMLMSAPLQDRYIDFIETYPDIVQRVPQKMIASYLGVTPEALSKIRGELSKK
ncbi:MAG TPA: Crp/Fnr family transcriptional regulator [Phnomibacter sp.]|nr:Crp/Fnr family transcriptional regulator [Phnomibacter sp.]